MTKCAVRHLIFLHPFILLPSQVVDLGVIAHPGSYLRDVWNLMDALVVVCASISFIFEMT
jgi:hypothetical protein